MRTCKKCGYKPFDEILDLHHIVPKILGGTDKDGRCLLCGENKGKDCHRKLHEFLRRDQEIKELLKRKFQEWLMSPNN